MIVCYLSLASLVCEQFNWPLGSDQIRSELSWVGQECQPLRLIRLSGCCWWCCQQSRLVVRTSERASKW